MRVGIDITSWSNLRGYGRYTRGLIPALVKKHPVHEYVLFVDRATYDSTCWDAWPSLASSSFTVVETAMRPTDAASAKGNRSLPEMWSFGKAVRRVALDVFFFPTVYTYFPVRTKADVVLGVHDIIAENYPQLVFPERKRRLLWNLKGFLARAQADWIVTVSDYARAGIVRRFNWPEERIWVVGEAPAAIFQPHADREQVRQVLAQYHLPPGARYLVCLGGLNPHKNIERLLVAVSQLRRLPEFDDLHLVLVGPAESDNFTPGIQRIRQAVQRLQLDGAVHLTGFVPDSTVACFLNEAVALVMPSLEEGFGLGAVEAAACGTPVIATQNSPLPELLCGGGLFINPHDTDALHGALVQVLSDEVSRQQLAETARMRARMLTWSRAAAQFAQLLTRLEKNKYAPS